METSSIRGRLNFDFLAPICTYYEQMHLTCRTGDVGMIWINTRAPHHKLATAFDMAASLQPRNTEPLIASIKNSKEKPRIHIL